MLKLFRSLRYEGTIGNVYATFLATYERIRQAGRSRFFDQTMEMSTQERSSKNYVPGKESRESGRKSDVV